MSFTLDPSRNRVHSARQSLRLPIVLAITLVVAGCFEDPVEEQLELCLSDGEALAIVLDIELHGTPENENPSFARRILDVGRSLLEGYGDWHDRFERLSEPVVDGIQWRKVDGHLDSYRRWAVTESPAVDLRDFFSDVPIEVAFVAASDRNPFNELSLFPVSGDRATGGDRARVNRELGELARKLARYYWASNRLWTYLEANPHRRRPVFESLFADLLDREDDWEPPELEEEEQDLQEPIAVSQEEILKIFEVRKGDAFTLQELSRRVYDPFPARVRIDIYGEVVERVGFEPVEGVFQVPRTSFWDAVSGIEGLWLSPDPLEARVRHQMAERRQFDLEGFLARRFYSDSPRAEQIMEALQEELEPLAEYSLVWRAFDVEEEGEGKEEPERDPLQPCSALRRELS